ncbi:hypothetical protein [Agromyces mediolanus]|uniref:hypothetical protein n=1 Tax=Agromyces mediolanus TaxID=41986 RepID=UPI001E40B865|nr:hypothetical protein [Agromyces mediolanus]MCD1570574.1 hypothetical protein [Agromyces mediolanus]
MSDARRIVAGELRRAAPVSIVLVPILLVGAQLGFGAMKLDGAVFRDELDLFGQAMMSPLAPLLPMIAVLSGSRSLLASVRSRFVFSARTRVGPRALVNALLASGAATAFVPVFIGTAVVGGLVFFGAPAIVPEPIDPSVYGITPDELARDAAERVSLSQLLAGGALSYVLGYSLWVGVASAVFATMGNVLILVLPSPLLGFFLPFGVYLAHSVAAGLLDRPEWSALFAVYPFGLVQQPIGAALAPIGIIALFVGGAWLATALRASRLVSLR